MWTEPLLVFFGVALSRLMKLGAYTASLHLMARPRVWVLRVTRGTKVILGYKVIRVRVFKVIRVRRVHRGTPELKAIPESKEIQGREFRETQEQRGLKEIRESKEIQGRGFKVTRVRRVLRGIRAPRGTRGQQGLRETQEQRAPKVIPAQRVPRETPARREILGLGFKVTQVLRGRKGIRVHRASKVTRGQILPFQAPRVIPEPKAIPVLREIPGLTRRFKAIQVYRVIQVWGFRETQVLRVLRAIPAQKGTLGRLVPKETLELLVRKAIRELKGIRVHRASKVTQALAPRATRGLRETQVQRVPRVIPGQRVIQETRVSKVILGWVLKGIRVQRGLRGTRG
jgi:hypothetical protein